MNTTSSLERDEFYPKHLLYGSKYARKAEKNAKKCQVPSFFRRLPNPSFFNVMVRVVARNWVKKAGEPPSGHVTALVATDSESPSNFEKL